MSGRFPIDTQYLTLCSYTRPPAENLITEAEKSSGAANKVFWALGGPLSCWIVGPLATCSMSVQIHGAKLEHNSLN